jgi:FeS assembly SUF system regulator
MLRMTKQADYGIVLLTHMSINRDRLHNAPDLADEAHLPQPTVSKILKQLARHRILESHRGVKGGYSLARRPAEISAAEIISALDGPIAITECIDDSPGECSQEPICPLRGNWQRINLAIREALDQISLEDLLLPQTNDLVHLGTGSNLTDATLR